MDNGSGEATRRQRAELAQVPVFQGFRTRLKAGVHLHLVDATALLAESTPVLAAFETAIAGMSVAVSLNARLIAACLTYFGGTGYIYARGRDVSRRVFKIGDKTREKIQHFHDSAYLGVFNLIIAPPLYFVSGAREIREIAIGTATAVAFGLVNGGAMGYFVDAFRDLSGLKECNRTSYPELIRKQNAAVKKGILLLVTLVAVGITGLIYVLKNRMA
jgi:hypothetical protein